MTITANCPRTQLPLAARASKILRLLESDQPGERHNACDALHRLAHEHRLNMIEVCSMVAVPAEPRYSLPAPRRQRPHDQVRDLWCQRHGLSAWEFHFV